MTPDEPTRSWLDRTFGLTRAGTSVGVELRAGLATFLTMAYILLVNPQILGEAGMPIHDVAAATAIASAIGCFTMAALANYPFALAPGMGLNAYFAFGVVLGLGISWQVALAAVFVEGIVFLALSLTGVRTAIVEAIPLSIRAATVVGIGLLLALIGLRGAGIVVDDPATLIRLGDLEASGPALALAGIVAIAALQALRVPGAIVLVIVAISGTSWALGTVPLPERWWSAPSLPTHTLGALDFSGLFTGELLAAILAFFLVDLLDTAGTLMGVGQLAGLVDDEGRLERSRGAFAADAIATSVGALLGTSTVTSYVESGAGVEEGGRTGLVAVTVGVLFLASLLLAPAFVAIPAAATAPALVVVGAMMMRGAGRIEWGQPAEAVPAFLTAVVMPFTGSIANGLAAGILGWVAIRVLSGRWRDVSWIMVLLSLALALFLIVLRAA